MTYYSGTSRCIYALRSIQTSMSPQILFEIHCSDNEENDFAICTAIGFARKRARQDKSEPLVIEITKPEEFERTGYPCYPILKGKLTPQNHRVHSVDELTAKVLREL